MKGGMPQTVCEIHIVFMRAIHEIKAHFNNQRRR